MWMWRVFLPIYMYELLGLTPKLPYGELLVWKIARIVKLYFSSFAVGQPSWTLLCPAQAGASCRDHSSIYGSYLSGHRPSPLVRNPAYSSFVSPLHDVHSSQVRQSYRFCSGWTTCKRLAPVFLYKWPCISTKSEHMTWLSLRSVRTSLKSSCLHCNPTNLCRCQ